MSVCWPLQAVRVRPPAKPRSSLFTRRCCGAVALFVSEGCSSDPTLLSILPGVGIQPAGLNATLAALEQACSM